MNPVSRILVPTDLSECAGAAAAWAAGLARQLGAVIELVTVVDTTHFNEIYGDETLRNQRIAHIRGEAGKQLEAFAQRYLGGLEQVRREVRDGNTMQEILAAAGEKGCELIVMGTHGRTGVAHLLIGSVAEKVVRQSTVPVLTVRPPRA
ncbi:MAG: universal stress protein [Gammaproteobacteria bacterium]|jgi:universal stress protein A|nr:universal stress protein [Gammaproteobacteria bacterium]